MSREISEDAFSNSSIVRANLSTKSAHTNKIYLSVIEARDLPPADSNGKADPYVKIADGKGLLTTGLKTKRQDKTLNPQWDQNFEIDFDYRFSKLKLQVYDHDLLKDDFMCKASVGLEQLYGGAEIDSWFPLRTKEKKPAGEIHLKIRGQFSLPVVEVGKTLTLSGAPQISLGLGWEPPKAPSDEPVVVTGTLIALTKDKLMVESVNESSVFNGALVHTKSKEDDEEIKIDFAKLPADIATLVVMVNSNYLLSKFQSIYFRLSDGDTPLAFYRSAKLAEKPGLLFATFTRSADNNDWTLTLHATPVEGRAFINSMPEVRTLLQ